MKSRLIAILAAASLGVGSLAAFAADLPPPDKFLGKAIQDGRAEIELCKLALQKSADPAVKQFAQRMIDDHAAIDEKIEALARSKQIRLPDGISLKQKASNDLLAARSGKGFDKAFMSHNVSDHEKDVKEFGKEAQGAADADIKAFASDTLQTLKTHLQLARDVASRIGK